MRILRLLSIVMFFTFPFVWIWIDFQMACKVSLSGICGYAIIAAIDLMFTPPKKQPSTSPFVDDREKIMQPKDIRRMDSKFQQRMREMAEKKGYKIPE